MVHAIVVPLFHNATNTGQSQWIPRQRPLSSSSVGRMRMQMRMSLMRTTTTTTITMILLLLLMGGGVSSHGVVAAFVHSNSNHNVHHLYQHSSSRYHHLLQLQPQLQCPSLHHHPYRSTSTTTTATRLYLAGKNKNAKHKNKNSGTVTVNRVAYRNYEVLETLEAGISLTGTEVKAVRDGKLNLRDGYVRAGGTSGGSGKSGGKNNNKSGSCQLMNVHIGKHAQAGPYFQHEERRVRPLLLHKAQARKWGQLVEQQPGLTIVPLKAYFNADNRLKLEIALCRGKNVRDKRATIQQRDQAREAHRMIKSFRGAGL